MDELNTDVSAELPSTAESTADGTPAISPNEAIATTPQVETAEESAAPPLVPENDDDLAGQETNPHVQAVKQLRGELRGRDEEWKPWREVVKEIGDPTLVSDYHQVMQGLHTPVEGQPGVYTSKPALDKLEEISPGTANELFFDLLNYQITDDTGREDTMVRHMMRSWGLDPDRLDDYRSIDTIRASGVVTPDDLAGIPERLHDAFRALSSAQRDDIVLQKDAVGKYSPATLEYLHDKAEALEARQWREQDTLQRQQAAEQQQQAAEQELQTTIIQDLTTEAQSIRDSILTNLSSQVTFSSDPVQDSLAKAGIMALVQQVQSPYPYQQQAALAMLKKVGIEPNGFAELLNRFEERRAAYKRFEVMGDQLQARRALSEATIAKQQVLARANDYTLRLAKANGERVASAVSQQGNQLAAATARFVPAGGQVPTGSTNPYEQNPHPVGSQEYFTFNRKLDREFKITGASMFGG